MYFSSDKWTRRKSMNTDTSASGNNEEIQNNISETIKNTEKRENQGYVSENIEESVNNNAEIQVNDVPEENGGGNIGTYDGGNTEELQTTENQNPQTWTNTEPTVSSTDNVPEPVQPAQQTNGQPQMDYVSQDALKPEENEPFVPAVYHGDEKEERPPKFRKKQGPPAFNQSANNNNEPFVSAVHHGKKQTRKERKANKRRRKKEYFRTLSKPTNQCTPEEIKIRNRFTIKFFIGIVVFVIAFFAIAQVSGPKENISKVHGKPIWDALDILHDKGFETSDIDVHTAGSDEPLDTKEYYKYVVDKTDPEKEAYSGSRVTIIAKQSEASKKVEKIRAEEEKKEQEKINNPDIYKPSCQEVSYDELQRNPGQYAGKDVTITGKILQATKDASGNKIYLVYATQGDYGIWDDIIMVTDVRNDQSVNFIDDDIVKIYGRSAKTTEYTNALGSEQTVPLIGAKYIDLVQKASEQ